MKRSTAFFLTALSLQVVATTMFASDAELNSEDGPEPPPSTLNDRFRTTRDQLDTLFRIRDSVAPSPQVTQDPFRAPKTSENNTDVAAGGGEAKATPTSDEDLLARWISSLATKPGYIQMGSTSMVAVNQSNYRDGQTIRGNFQGQILLIRVKTVTSKGVTFQLNNAERFVEF